VLGSPPLGRETGAWRAQLVSLQLTSRRANWFALSPFVQVASGPKAPGDGVAGQLTDVERVKHDRGRNCSSRAAAAAIAFSYPADMTIEIALIKRRRSLEQFKVRFRASRAVLKPGCVRFRKIRSTAAAGWSITVTPSSAFT
jgi:hypothetical protein